MNAKIDNFIKVAKEVGVYSFDFEHDPSLSPNMVEGFVPHGCGFGTEDLTFYERNFDNISYLLKTLFATDAEAIAYNGKYDLKCATACGIVDSDEYPENFVDPMVGINLLEDNRRPNQLGLDKVILDKYGYQMRKFMDSWGKPEFLAYACDDAKWEYTLWKDVRKKLVEQNLLDIFKKVLMPVAKVFADIERCGILWDLTKTRVLLRRFQKLRDVIEQEIFDDIGPINLRSDKQLEHRLFEELGYSTRGIEMTTSGSRFSTGAKSMDTLARKYPVCKKIKIYRTLNKMNSTYIEPFARYAMNDQKGRIHSTFWIVSATGRVRSSGPNVQNLPAYYSDDFIAWVNERLEETGIKLDDLNIRRNVIAPEGYSLLIADYSQIELRAIAHVTKDATFLEAYRRWQCTYCGKTGESAEILHECPHCGRSENEAILSDKHESGFWHGLDLHQMTTDTVPALRGDRQNGKKANFALVYYATAKKMAFEYPELTISEWQRVIDDYFIQYPGIRAWHHRMERLLGTTRSCVDIFGRRRRISKSDIIKNPKNALNMLINFNPQASATGLIELAMGNLHKKWISEGVWKKDIQINLMVHDELVFECKKGTESHYIKDITDIMEHAVQLRVPLRVDTKIASDWGVK